MRMKRHMIFGLTAALACAALFAPAALAAAENGPKQLAGLVTEVLDNGLVLSDPEQGEVLLNIDPDTVLEGVLAEEPLAVGMYVLAMYNGNLTRTNPPQARADRLACYPLTGKVAEILPEGILLAGDPIFGDVIVNLSGSMPQVHTGVPITVYYNGAMAMSLPGRVTARHIVVPVLTGTVKSVSEDKLVLDAGEEARVTVLLKGSTLLPASFFDGSIKGRSVIVYYDGEREENQVTALEVLDPASIVEEPMPLTPEEEDTHDAQAGEDAADPEDDTSDAKSPAESQAPEDGGADADGTDMPGGSQTPEASESPEPAESGEAGAAGNTPAPDTAGA